MGSDNPGLSGFSRTWEKIKHIGGKVLKAAAWGAAITGAIGLLAAGPLTGLLGGIGGLFGIGSSSIAGGMGSMLLKTLVVGAVPGAIIGGAFGLAKGLSGANAAADDEEERRVAAFERREVRHERKEMLAMQRAQQGLMLAKQAEEMGVSPGFMLGKGHGNQRGV